MKTSCQVSLLFILLAVRLASAQDPRGSHDGDTLVGEAGAAPWTYQWKTPPVGTHALLAIWETAAGKTGSTPPALVIVRTK